MMPLIQLKNIEKNYQMGSSKLQALQDVNLTINQGEFVGLMGPSGSGKSTLLHICGLIDRPTKGEYLYKQNLFSDLSESDFNQIRRDKIGFIFQSFNLIPVLTLFENIEYPLLLINMPKPERTQRVRDIMAATGLAQYEHHRPDQVSGGQRQRVAIARALVKKPELVIADEPTANLDSMTAYQVLTLMKSLAATHGTTFLIATHDLAMTKECHRVVNMKDGSICQE